MATIPRHTKQIISTAAPNPSRRIIGGSNQRSTLRDQLQGSQGWKYNHAPIGLAQDQNWMWWRQSADVKEPPLSYTSIPNNIYSFQSTRVQVRRALDSRRISSVAFDFDDTITGGSNSPINKKQNLLNVTFDSIAPELDVSDVIYPNTKKRLSFRATMDGVTYNGAQVTPFSAFSSSVVSGYRYALKDSSLAINNLHDDVVYSYNNETPIQGPFTERFVGGLQGRHNAVNSSLDFRKEVNKSTFSHTGGSILRPIVGTPQGQYLRGNAAKAPVNISNIKTSLNITPGAGVRVVGNYTRNYEVVQTADRAATNMDLAFNTQNFNYSAPSAFIPPPIRRALGLSGSADYPAPRERTDTRVNDTIFVNRFASPGGKTTSKQQFRDVASDQMAPNSVLPFRNLLVRMPYNKQLSTHVAFGGMVPGSTTEASVYKTQRNETQRIEQAPGMSEAFVTGNVYDDYWVTRPIPAGDSTQWFMSLSGSNTTTYSNYVRAGCFYPDNITSTVTYFAANPFGSSCKLATNGKYKFAWINSIPNVSPWTQIQNTHKPAIQNLRKNNLFELPPEEVEGYNTVGYIAGTKTRTYTSRTGGTINNYYSRQYKEPMITSRYKPLVHQIETLVGDADSTSENKITLNLEYSYGNSLMGFANKELNKELQGSFKFNHNKVRRPYEVLRKEILGDSSPSLNGINMIKMFAYRETIFPREVNTYLSGSRARLSFVNSFWKNDNVELPVTGWYYNYGALFYAPAVIKENNPQLPRIIGPFTTSQGYVAQRKNQLPYNSSNPAYQQATGFGSGSIWPLDSYLYAAEAQKYSTAPFRTGSFTSSIVLSDQTTTECGELMMTSFGTINDKASESDPLYNTQSFAYLGDAVNKVSAQYLYCRPFITGNLATTQFGVESAFPGGPAFSRPPWTAGSERRFVDGEAKYSLNNKSYPFYNNYNDWVADLRLIGKAHSILPEYRISENISKFRSNRSLFVAISSSLEITGASANLYDGTNPEFYTRYSTTDKMEFMSDFMSYDKGDVDYIFNKYPRHFELSSDALVKLLPYDGFYPVNRTLELATLYSQSYGPYAQYAGASSVYAGRWRTLLRPFYAPGIMYNSIKSGIAVDYPIRRNGRNKPSSLSYEDATNQPWASYTYDPLYPTYNIGGPLFGCLVGGTTSSLPTSANLPGNTRRNPNGMDWADPSVNNLFWADRLPFESILAPEEYLTADLTSTTGSLATILSDINPVMRLPVTGAFTPGKISSDNLYKKAVSNFIANVPQFFLRTKNNKFGFSGKMTKFVSQFGNPSKGSQEVTSAARKVSIDPNQAYMMEIGLLKTNKFNLYSNPAAFGQSTSTNSLFKPWNIAAASGSWTPSGSNWPTHRGEYAPFTPPYYYGPSLARITFMPTGDKTEYTLDEILNNDRGEVFVDYINESGSYYDINSGSFVSPDNTTTISSNQTPVYGWNRAWLNRMDIDASITIGNEFPIGPASTYRSSDPNRWTIMPKWETPVLDFPNIVRTEATPGTPVAFASASMEVISEGALRGEVLVGAGFALTSSTTVVEFLFNDGIVAPNQAAPTLYEIAYSASVVTSDADAAAQIKDAIELARGDGNLDIQASLGSGPASINLVDLAGGPAINGSIPTNFFGTPIGPSTMTVTAFAGGAPAVPASSASVTGDYNFSSSVAPTEFTSSTQGMWHQYGAMPDAGQGIYMYIKDIPTGEHEEYDLVSTYNYLGMIVGSVGRYYQVKKVPKFVVDSGREVSSLADLCGFDPDEIIRTGFDPTKAKRIGELAVDNENSISEAIVAMPFYIDESGEARLITLQASPSELGPKIKEFRKNFTKYSMPPVLATQLLGMVPKGYPFISDTINPFGGDEYDEILEGENIKQTPVVYLMEHTANLTRQDLADIWQGIMPDLSKKVNFSFSSIDHYMPGDNVEEDLTQFPEVLKEQLNIDAKIKDGHPRYDLLDIAEKACKQGFFPEIRWLVFKVKQKGYSTYADMIQEEVDGPNALGYDNAKQFLSLQGLPEDQIDRILGGREEYAKNAYIKKHSLNNPTYNWPYDYCSLIESVKVDTKVGFRPDLKKEYGDT